MPAIGTPADVTVEIEIPAVRAGYAQREIRYLTSDDPVMRVVVGDEPASTEVRRSLLAYRYELRSQIDETLVTAFYEDQTGFFAYYTRAEPGLSVRAPSVIALADQARRGRASPLAIARAAYELTIDALVPARLGTPVTPEEALAAEYADDRGYAHLLVSVLRAAQIPARVVSGVLVGETVYPHLWVEFFVTGIGWVSADPSLGDGAIPAGFPSLADPRPFYFGNLDSRRITFSSGTAPISSDEPSTIQRSPDDALALAGVFVVTGDRIAVVETIWHRPVLLSLIAAD